MFSYTYRIPLSTMRNHRFRMSLSLSLFMALGCITTAQNSMVGDGFGGRGWYRPTNYTVGSYSAFSLCYSDPCDSSTNQLYGWGGDNVGELGNGLGANCTSTPGIIPGMNNVRYYSTGYWMGAIKNDGTGWVWGGDFGFVGPTQVITDVKFVDASSRYCTFIKNDGTVWSIGDNGEGIFGDGTQVANYTTPVQMAGVTGALRVAGGLFTNYVLLSDSTVRVVGHNYQGLVGDPSYTDTYLLTAVPIAGLSGIIDIKTHTEAAAVLNAQGEVYCWGFPGFTGDGDFLQDTIPQRVEGLNNIVAISGCTDGEHFLALDADRNCYAWGNYNISELFYAPQLVATDVIDIMAGETFSYIVKADGTLWATGFSLCGSVFLDQPNHGQTNPQVEFTQLDPSAVAGSCPLQGTTAIPAATCSDGTITVFHFGGQAPYTYDIGNGPQTSNIFTGVALGNYTVTVIDANGCAITVPCTVNPDGLSAIVEDMGNVSACADEGYTLPSGTTVYISGNYADTLVASIGCDSVRLFNVLIDPLPTANQQDTLCNGAEYILPSGTLVNTPGVYTDTLLLVGACDTVYTITLIGSALPSVVASITAQDTVITPGESVLLFGDGGLSYDWSPSSTLSCAACPNPTATPTETTEYCVVVSNNNSCADDTACIRITVLNSTLSVCNAESIFIPSAFSPNASGKNDLQCIYGGDCIASMVFDIYDRWGNKVFESTDTKQCWDGLYKGDALDPGVFVYSFNATLSNGETLQKKGNITLVR
jgi:gliding motility-associated-like protein